MHRVMIEHYRFYLKHASGFQVWGDCFGRSRSEVEDEIRKVFPWLYDPGTIGQVTWEDTKPDATEIGMVFCTGENIELRRSL